MTEHIDSDVSEKPEECQEEWEMYIGTDTKIKMKCSRCGHISEVPDWILGEFAEIDHITGKTTETSIECPKCNGAMYRIR